ncbi:transcriptional regulator [Staphylococcus nepalensis]|uniref:helix-turn-helix domain-containing protein n=1 Tax=Staphylococcus nepalensis TaxID=214473 RepID=UPI000D58AF79|nr:helix-turn-helix transcriptional regulator [Staphylococcus nepalensis]AWI44651.1 transcriptional regulator [Staphylococcus nepalensis]
MEEYSKNIKFLRTQRGMTQQKLADKTGQTKQVISNLERGYSAPNNKQLLNLAHALDCTTNDILGDVEDDKRNYQAIMFKDKEVFDELSSEEKTRIIQSLEDQADYLIAKTIKQKKNDDK